MCIRDSSVGKRFILIAPLVYHKFTILYIVIFVENREKKSNILWYPEKWKLKKSKKSTAQAIARTAPLVDGKELESLTPCTSSRCSTSWANRPYRRLYQRLCYYNIILGKMQAKNSKLAQKFVNRGNRQGVWGESGGFIVQFCQKLPPSHCQNQLKSTCSPVRECDIICLLYTSDAADE